ncbi:hypothetical protein F-E9_71 [Faustovirus]|nr:hypothetical protein F-E9_71 [Faustovirus]
MQHNSIRRNRILRSHNVKLKSRMIFVQTAMDIPRDITDIIYNYGAEKWIWGMTCRHYAALYRDSVRVDATTKYTKNFARMCVVCARVDVVGDMTCDEKMTLCNLALVDEQINSYSVDDMTIGGIPIMEIDMDDPPVPVEFIASRCRKFVKENNLRDLLQQQFAKSIGYHCDCKQYINLHSFAITTADELYARLRRGENLLFNAIKSLIGQNNTAVKFQLWYNSLRKKTYGRFEDIEKYEQQMKEKLHSHGFGFTWYTL